MMLAFGRIELNSLLVLFYIIEDNNIVRIADELCLEVNLVDDPQEDKLVLRVNVHFSAVIHHFFGKQSPEVFKATGIEAKSADEI